MLFIFWRKKKQKIHLTPPHHKHQLFDTKLMFPHQSLRFENQPCTAAQVSTRLLLYYSRRPCHKDYQKFHTSAYTSHTLSETHTCKNVKTNCTVKQNDFILNNIWCISNWRRFDMQLAWPILLQAALNRFGTLFELKTNLIYRNKM